jgi:hypothetical protein
MEKSQTLSDAGIVNKDGAGFVDLPKAVGHFS